MRIVLVSVFIVLLSSCGKNKTNQNKETGPARVIDLLQESEAAICNISEITTDIRYIPLETNENSLIRTIDKVIIRDKCFFLQSNSTHVMCYDFKGNFLYKLDRTGRGPGEYLSIYDFDISANGKTLVILSKSKIILYKNTGSMFEFKSEIDLVYPFPDKISFLPGTENILLSITPVTGHEASLSVLISPNGDSLCIKPNCYKAGETETITNWAMLDECLQYVFGTNLCFKEEFSDTVFCFNKNTTGYYPWLILDSHGKGASSRLRYDRQYAQNYKGELFWVYKIFESPRYIIITYQHNHEMDKGVVYDKVTNRKYKIMNANMFTEDINGGPDFKPSWCSDGTLISWQETLILKKHTVKKEFANALAKDIVKKKELEKLAASLKETDNPVIVLVRLKK
jgi:hypothetical protein